MSESMKVLVINAGSSSIKFELFSMPDEHVEAQGLLQRIGEPQSELTYTIGGVTRAEHAPIADHGVGLHRIIAVLKDSAHGGLENIAEIAAVGHRVVHGGERFKAPAVVDEAALAAIKSFYPLAPLHNPPNVKGIEVAQEVLPAATQVMIFDTAFHQSIPQQAFMYALPYELYERHGARRYGFHGTSHDYVTQRAAALLEKPVDEINVITAHLGNGASITAVREGKSVDTSMGLTPLEGLMMGTRCGDIDPALIPYLARVEALSVAEIDTLLNKKSGLLGVSGVSNDMRSCESAAAEGNARARLALDMYAYRVKKYIGAYTAVLGRVDALVFTAGIGENGSALRAQVLAGLAGLGYELDAKKNSIRGKAADIATDASKSRIFVIPTNEELMIARGTYAVATGAAATGLDVS